jgi:FtsH-binding integral membrane protein
LLSITLGLFISPILRGVENDVILNVSILVTLITLLMSISGLMFPKFYSKISGILCITSIICFIVFPILHFYIPSLNLTIWDYLVSGFFALNIGYETSKGSKGDLDKISAIRVATNLYVSSIMLFAKIINLYSDAKSKVAM